jgi:hypothetical protein
MLTVREDGLIGPNFSIFSKKIRGDLHPKIGSHQRRGSGDPRDATCRSVARPRTLIFPLAGVRDPVAEVLPPFIRPVERSTDDREPARVDEAQVDPGLDNPESKDREPTKPRPDSVHAYHCAGVPLARPCARGPDNSLSDSGEEGTAVEKQMAGVALWAFGLAIAVLLVLWAAVSSHEPVFALVLGAALLGVFAAAALAAE